MRPVFDQAWRSTDAALSQPESPRVQNSFDVKVSLGSSPQSNDPSALEEALTEVLRQAARRHGLDV